MISISFMALSLSMYYNDTIDSVLANFEARKSSIGIVEYTLVCEGERLFDAFGKAIDAKYSKSYTFCIDYSNGRYRKVETDEDGSIVIQTFDGKQVYGAIGLKGDLSNFNDIKIGIATGDYSLTPFNTDLFALLYITGSLSFSANEKYYAGHFTWQMDKLKLQVAALDNLIVLKLKEEFMNSGYMRVFTLDKNKQYNVTNVKYFHRNGELHMNQDIVYTLVNGILFPKTWKSTYYKNKSPFRKESWNVSKINRLQNEPNFELTIAEGQKVAKIHIDKDYIYKPESRVDDDYIMNDGSLVKERSWYTFVKYSILLLSLFIFLAFAFLYFRKRCTDR